MELTADTAAVVRRLHRIEGQVRGITRMVEQDRYCLDVLTQVAAVSGALHEVALALLKDHVNNCLAHGATSDSPERDTKVNEAVEAIARLLRR